MLTEQLHEAEQADIEKIKAAIAMYCMNQQSDTHTHHTHTINTLQADMQHCSVHHNWLTD